MHHRSRTLAVVFSGILMLGLAVTGGAPSQAQAITQPQIDSAGLVGGPIVFTDQSAFTQATAHIEEPDGWALRFVQVWDPRCSIDPSTGFPSDSTDPACANTWLSNFNPPDTSQAENKDVPLTGNVPNKFVNGDLVRGRIGLVVWAYYSQTGVPGTQVFSGDFNALALSGTRSQLTGPSKPIRSGATLRLDVAAQIFNDDWTDFNDEVVAIQRQPNTNGGWFTADHVVTDNGTAESVLPDIEDSANWRALINASDQGVPTRSWAGSTSNVVPVAIQGDEPPPPPPPGHVPSRPTHTHARAGNHQATLTWKPPAQRHGKIDKYRVHRFNAKDRVVSRSARKFVFKHLKNNATYTLYVQAHNAAGWGPLSKGVTARPHN